MKHRKFALALGWWSARWLAHVGILQFLEENNYTPEMIAGTSMGSILGWLYALGYSVKEIKKIVQETGVMDIIAFNPIGGIFSSKRVIHLFEPYFGEKTFSDTQIPLSVIATSLTSGKRVIFTSGKILDAICASIAIPGIFSPYKIGNEYFVDGSVRENLPLSACGDLPIVASSVVMPPGNNKLHKMNVFVRNMTSISESLNIRLEEQENLRVSLYDDILLLRITDTKVHYMDFKNGKKLASHGYDIIKNSSIKEFLQEK